MEDRNITSLSKCPDSETVLSVMESSDCVSPETAGDVLSHLGECQECRQAVSFVCAALVAEKKGELQLERCEPCWNRVISEIDWWVERSDEYPDALAAAAPKRNLVFQSKVGEKDLHYWRAEVKLPAPDDPNGVLHVVAKDAQGKSLDGVFVLCGVKCQLQNGKEGEIASEIFRMNHTQGGVSFTFADGKKTVGVPVLGSIL